MEAMTSQKAYLYETSSSAISRENRSLDYKLEGHHAKLEVRDSLFGKGKFALSIGRKIDLKKERENLVIEKKKDKHVKIKPVILPECVREETEIMEECSQVFSDGESNGRLMRENTDDVSLTKELLENEIIRKQFRSKVCSACFKLDMSKRHEHFSKLNDSLDIKPCDLCMKQENIKNNSSKEDKTLLMSIVYPHDFYDRYQSVRRQFNSNNIAEDCDKKVETRERKKRIIRQKTILPKTTFTLPDVVNEGDKVVLKPHIVKLKDSDKKDKELKSEVKFFDYEKQRTQNVRSSSNQLKHLRGQPHMKAYFLAALTSKHIVKDKQSVFDHGNSFKGLMLPKSDKFQKPQLPDIKHSFYNVGSLGLTIGIPEYNEQLRNRQNFTSNYLSRAFTTLTEIHRPQSLLPPMKNKVRAPGSLGHKSM